MKLFLVILVSISSIVSYSQKISQAPAAADVIAAAQKKAAKKNKKVMVKYTATWCGYCHKMDTAMDDRAVAKYFKKNYEVVRIHIKESKKNKNLEHAGGESLFTAHGGSDNTGIPYWAILDGENKVIANSKNKAADVALDAEGENVGCPMKENEVGYFVRVLQATGNFDDAAIEKIKKVFLALK